MSTKGKKIKHWFTAADALIIVTVMSLLIGSAVLFLFPAQEKNGAELVQAAMVVHVDEEINGINADDELFFGDVAVGSVQKIDKAANNVVVVIELEKENGFYSLGGEPVRINGDFTLETRFCKVTGVISDLGDKEE